VLDPKICPACGDRAERPTAEEAELICDVRAPVAVPAAAVVRAHRLQWRRQVHRRADPGAPAGRAVVVLEQDVLWIDGLRDDVDGHPAFRSVWLRRQR
jgi:hypothetical protein